MEVRHASRDVFPRRLGGSFMRGQGLLSIGAGIVRPLAVQAIVCEWCNAEAVLFVGNYISWEECPSCDQSRLVGWASCQPQFVLTKPRFGC